MRAMGFARFAIGNLRPLSAGVLLSFGSSYGQTFFIALFAAQVMEANGLSHGAWGGIYTLATTLSAVLMAWAGGLADLYRVRGLATACAVGLAAACLAMAISWHVASLVLAVLALRFFGQGMMSHLALVAMARWFTAGRGRAIAIAAMGFAVGQATLPVIFVALMELLDWRLLWAVAALSSLALVPPLLWATRGERPPAEIAFSTEALGMDAQHWSRAQALRDPVMWLTLPMILGPAAWGTALFFHQVHLAAVKGWPLAGFVALFPIYVGASVAATLAVGALVDRFGATRLLPLMAVPMALGFWALGDASGLGAAAVGLALLGLGWGAQATLPAAFWAEVYGTAHLGRIKALTGAAMVLGSAIGPGVTGVLIDRGTDFPDQMIWYAGYFALGGALTLVAALRTLPRLRPSGA